MLPQPEDEPRAQVGDGSNGEFAMAWLNAILKHRDWQIAMQCMTDDLRRAHALAWADEGQEVRHLLGPDLDDAIASLTDIRTNDPLWEAFASRNVRWYVEAFGDLADNLAIGGRSTPFEPDAEGFVIVDRREVQSPDIEVSGESGQIADGATMPSALDIVVRVTDLGQRIESWSPGPRFPNLEPVTDQA